ncbi:Tyrosine aminotransferase (L-tyrosine:2-oxoglutarate aminotransferase) [Mucor velutinosus]|uniref:Tyrosine aminotransferase (L-tyrosine:2-oxoglutarate aminotransferase) n=1 Tax=Mucor velutinosus TaxID=708070 RepID=A0AAN7DNJ9_9FUNG|nr:Tyrosine aminotransferase (L-tyrosine:2-oxoglutarate aminotransferase) [Mucor velutinosus]
MSFKYAYDKFHLCSCKSYYLLKIPSDFYYNKDSGNIVYNRRMIHHYKQYPPHEKYIHVANLLEDLYAFYRRTRKGKLATQDDTVLCSAVTSFLTKVYPSKLSNDGQTLTTQYVFILPFKKYTNRDFIDTTLRPLLHNTPWLTSEDLASKTVFYSRADTYAYRLNEQYELCLERERRNTCFALCKRHMINIDYC